jgi:hypothetical protein
VTDALKIDPRIDPGILADRLDKVHNLDTISCTPEQMGALQARMGQNKGRLIDPTQEKAASQEEEDRIGNAGTLRL